MSKEQKHTNTEAQFALQNVSARTFVATQVMNGFLANGSIRHHGGETITRRDPETDRKITAEEEQNEQIAHYTKVSYKIADALIKYVR